jgi:undecaprenyl-diphosphatase
VIAALLSVDAAIVLWVNGWQGVPAIDAFFLYATELGTPWFSLVPVCIAFAVRNPPRIRQIFLPATIGAVSGVINAALKVWIARPRPPLVVPGIRTLGPPLWELSFPSGHTLLAFIVLGGVWHLDRRLAYVWLPCAVLVGLSRIYLGVHFPSDVLAGAALGFAPTYFLSRRLKGKGAA